MRWRTAVLVLLFIISALFIPGQISAACIVQGPNIPDPTIANIESVRTLYGSSNCQIQVTIRLTESTASDPIELAAKIAAIKKANLLPTFRIDGATAVDSAHKAALNLSSVLGQFGMKEGSIVEFGNEVNLNLEGFSGDAKKYGMALSSFVAACNGCKVYLSSMGGAPGVPVDGTQKIDFIKQLINYMNSNSSGWQDKISGIAFNSIAATADQALEDWVNTLEMWRNAGFDTKGKSFFLTEVSPPGALISTANIDQFVKDVVAKFKNIQAKYPELKGFTFFFWDEKENKYMVFIDANGNVIKVKMDPGGNLPSLYDSVQKYKKTDSSGPIKKYEEESEQDCEVVEGAQGNPRSSPAPIYSKTSDLTEAEMREDAGLTFGSPVRGMKCGQVRSNPVMVYELAPYRLEDPPLCTSRFWTGKLDIENIAVPFAESIARHWGGEWDAEHVSDQEFNETHQKAIEGDMDAVVKIWRKVGVLSKLLSQDQQDQLRGQFLEYFKLAKNSSLYQNFLVANIALSSIPIPPKITDSDYFSKKTKWEENMRQLFGVTWRRDWSKVPYFPNEQVWGEIKMQVCSDKEYRFSTRYPELMKLGLAANELYKILTPQEMQENYYNASNANKKLKTPLKYLASNDLENNDNIIAVSLEKPMMAATSAPVQKSFIEKIKEFLAEVFGKFNPESQKVFAAPSPCYHHEVSVDSQNNITFCLVSDNGKDGDIQFDVGTTSMGQFAFNYRVHGGRYCWNSGPGGGPLKVSANGATTFRTKLDGCNSEDNQQFCTVTADNSGKVSTTCKLGTPLPPPEPACDATKSCCGKETKTCNVTCEICKHTQIAPPSTMELDQGKTAADKIKNKQTVGIGGGSPPLALTWLKPDLDENPHPRGNGCGPDKYGEKLLNTLIAAGAISSCSTDANCPRAELCEAYPSGKFCTPIKCEKTNERAIDIYNNAPFLASVWQQSAGDCYNDCLRDKKSEAQCKSQCENSNYQGFLNYFRPADNAKPKTPQSYMVTFPSCAGKNLDPTKYYYKDDCLELKPPSCCSGDITQCNFSDRRICTPQLCNDSIEKYKIDKTKDCGGGPCRCGQLIEVGWYSLGGKIDAKKTFQDSFDFESFYGCSMNEDKVFDDKGFRPSPGAVLVRYTNFQQTSGHLSGDEYQNIYVTMNDTPDPAANPESANRLMFYRIGGVCNANTWLSQKVLLPARE